MIQFLNYLLNRIANANPAVIATLAVACVVAGMLLAVYVN